MSLFKTHFSPQDVTVPASRGTDILSAALKAGIVLNSSCGGEGLCGKCRVIVTKGDVRREPSKLISDADRKKGYVLACEALIESDLEVTIPPESLESFGPAAGFEGVDEFSKGVVLKREGVFKFAPLVRKIRLQLPKPTLDDNVSDLDRITRAIEDRLEGVLVTARLGSIRHLDDILRGSDFKVTVTLAAKEGAFEIAAVEPGDTSGDNYGFAFDIGTTTVAGQLIDLNTKKIMGSRMSYNKQAAFGSDVITRIIYGSEDEGMKKLNDAVLENINEIITSLYASCGMNAGDVNAIMCAGNTTMMHLLFKIDPSGLRREPYIPTVSTFPIIHAGEAGIRINQKANVFSAPAVSSYIGGDIVAGIVACGLCDAEDLTLLVDIGTNGEVVLGNREWMMGCSASAGPAFEGSGLSCGMKAVKGAIQKLEIDASAEARLETVDGASPKGICGSGYIDLLKEMFKRKLMTKDGKINRSIRSKRVRQGGNCCEYVVAFKGEAGAERDIVINDDDIENLKRAKGALYSGIVTLLNKVGKPLAELKKVYIAGGFGNFLNIDNAIAIGLLPDIDRSIYEFIGNSSLAGARMSLVSREAYLRMFEINKAIMYVDLSSEPGYMDEYVASLFFPHTDMERFPSAR